MIPKKIHYCWFGRGNMPELSLRCIDSWKKYCPDYELVLWNEDNFDVAGNAYVKEAYEAKKYAFVTDYVRLYAMYTYGGIYMDTDVEVKQSLDSFLMHRAFSGFENYHDIPTGIMACEKDFPDFGRLLSFYDHVHFINKDGSYNMTTNVETITQYYEKKGLIRDDTFQTIDGFTLYPRVFFCPRKEDITSSFNETIYTVHHMAGSWLSEEERKTKNAFLNTSKAKIGVLVRKIVGKNTYDNIKRRKKKP